MSGSGTGVWRERGQVRDSCVEGEMSGREGCQVRDNGVEVEMSRSGTVVWMERGQGQGQRYGGRDVGEGER